MGAAGDMLMAALLELIPDQSSFLRQLNGLGIPGVRVTAEPSVKCGITGTHVSVRISGEEEQSLDVPADHHHTHDHGHSHDRHHHDHDYEHDHVHEHEHPQHSSISEIEQLTARLGLPDQVREDVLAVYGLIADAESHIHGKPVSEIHFHEVGMLDALADIVGVCLLVRQIAPSRIVASPVHVGSGQVRCAHGILPVPAPATAHILRGVPTYGGSIRGELCTPTGAALLRYFVDEFTGQPVMAVEKIGYGMGKKDFAAANCLRAMLGETVDLGDQIVELCCNLDDMTPEAIGYAQERLFEGGALDVFTTAIGMKKNRPGILLSCLCPADRRETMIRLIFLHTTTLGIREYRCNRSVLSRSERQVMTEYGTVRIKQAEGWGVSREKAEYEDVARIAREQHLALDETLKRINPALPKEIG